MLAHAPIALDPPPPAFLGLQLRAGSLDIRVASVPMGGLRRLLEDIRAVCGTGVETLKVEGQPVITGAMILGAAAELGMGKLHDVDLILARALPEWPDLDAMQQGKVRQRFSQVVFTAQFRSEAAKHGWTKEHSRSDRRKWCYGVSQ
ncbi:MAG: hypothetical protein ABR562_07430 [Thermoplasmatota archaeon]